jgi:hypothetical protein
MVMRHVEWKRERRTVHDTLQKLPSPSPSQTDVDAFSIIIIAISSIIIKTFFVIALIIIAIIIDVVLVYVSEPECIMQTMALLWLGSWASGSGMQ